MSQELKNAFEDIKAAFLKTTTEFAHENIEGTREDIAQWSADFFETLADAAAEPDPHNRERLMDAAWALLDQMEEAGRLRLVADGMARLRQFGKFAVSIMMKLLL